MRDDEAKIGFLSELNVSAEPTHPFLGMQDDETTSYRDGPYWISSNLFKESGRDANYLQVSETVRTRFTIDKHCMICCKHRRIDANFAYQSLCAFDSAKTYQMFF